MRTAGMLPIGSTRPLSIHATRTGRRSVDGSLNLAHATDADGRTARGCVDSAGTGKGLTILTTGTGCQLTAKGLYLVESLWPLNPACAPIPGGLDGRQLGGDRRRVLALKGVRRAELSGGVTRPSGQGNGIACGKFPQALEVKGKLRQAT
jgi:hypothetical protein